MHREEKTRSTSEDVENQLPSGSTTSMSKPSSGTRRNLNSSEESVIVKTREKIKNLRFSGPARIKTKKTPMLTVEPRLLEFLAPGWKDIGSSKIQSTTLTLNNEKRKRRLAFKVLTNQPFFYLVRPNTGFIDPGESKNVFPIL